MYDNTDMHQTTSLAETDGPTFLGSSTWNYNTYHECFENIYVCTHGDENNYKLMQFPRSFLYRWGLYKIGREVPPYFCLHCMLPMDTSFMTINQLGLCHYWLIWYSLGYCCQSTWALSEWLKTFMGRSTSWPQNRPFISTSQVLKVSLS